MTTPGPPVTTPTPPVPPFAGPPSTPGQVAAWTVYQQQLKEFNNPRVVPFPPTPIGITPTKSIHPDWVNPCAECGAQIQFPCVNQSGQPLGYLHAPRLLLQPPPAVASGPPQPPNVFSKNGL